MARFAFRFDPVYRVLGAPFGVSPQTTVVEVADARLKARFGPWVVDTPLANVGGAEVTGPYSRWKTVGPAHLSMADRGLTMVTNRRQGLCIRFRTPVRGGDPFGWLRHPGLTVTVEQVEDLRRVLTEPVDPSERVEWSTGVPGESPWGLLARLARWPAGMGRAAAHYVRLRSSGAVVRSFETSTGSPPPVSDQPGADDIQPIHTGAGAVYERLYRVTVRGSQLTPEQLLDTLASDLNRVSPGEVAEFVSQTSGADEALPAQEFMVRMPGPWKAPVRCVDRTPTSFRLVTLPGHMEAGQIEFRTCSAEGNEATEVAMAVTFQIRSIARSRGRAFRLLYDRFWFPGEMQQYMWVRLCEGVVDLAGGRPEGPVEVKTIRYEE